MKKISLFVMGVLCFVPLSVKADMSSPEIKSLYVTPKNESGATLYDTSRSKEIGTLKYKDKIKVTYEYNDGKIVYGCNYDDDAACVNMKEVKSVSDNETEKEDIAKYVGRVFEKDGVEMYEGPSYAYKKLDKTIAYGKEFKIADISNRVGTWTYAEYDGVKGYVDTANSSIGMLYNAKFILGDNNKEYSEYYLSNPWDRTFYVKVDNIYKNFSTSDLILEFRHIDKFELNKDCKLYNKYDAAYETAEDKSTTGTLAKGTKVEVLYEYNENEYTSVYVKTGAQKGWLIPENGEESLELTCITIDYDKLTLKDAYTKYENYTDLNESRKVKASDYFKDIQDDEEDEDVVVPSKDDDKKDSKKVIFAGLTKDQIIIVSSIGAALIVLSSVVTIILVNKRKNKNSVQE